MTAALARGRRFARLAGKGLDVRFLELFSLRERSRHGGKDLADHGFAPTDMGTQRDQIHAGLLKGSLGKGGEGIAILHWFRRVHVNYIGK